MNKFLILIYLLIRSGCNDPENVITKDGIKSNRTFKNGFELFEIFVKEFNEKGKPIEYSKGISVFCGPINEFSGFLGDSFFSEKEKQLISLNRKIIDTIMKLNGNSIGGEGHDKRIEEFIESQVLIDSIKNKRFPFNPQNSIMFYEKSENYKWVFTKKQKSGMYFYDYSKPISDTLPFVLKTNQWYFINFSNASNTKDVAFFLIKKDGTLKQYNYYEVKSGV